MTISKTLVPALCALLFAGCGDDDANGANYTPPSEYDFSSRTNTDFDSSVSNKVPVTHALMGHELVTFIASSEISGLSSASVAYTRLNQIFTIGSVPPSEGADTSLVNYNIYTGVLGSPTTINLLPSSAVAQQTFADIRTLENSNSVVSTNLSDFVFSADRSLPFSTITSIDTNGTIIEYEEGDFIGWPLIDDVSNGNFLPQKLLNSWLEEVSVLMTDEDLSSSSISEEGIHLDELISSLILGAINYSTISQFNLIADKGLLAQNSQAFNLSEVELQLYNVGLAESILEKVENSIESLKEDLSLKLEEWEAVDPTADPALGLEHYTNIPQYQAMTLVTKYFDIIDDIDTQEVNKITNEVNVAEKEALVDNILPYTDLANNWDEAFGYFGASRSYGLHTDAEIVEKAYYDDVDADGSIDAFTEVNFGYSVLASERDAGAALANTNFSDNIWNAFLIGRQIIQQNHGREAVQFVGYHNDLTAQADIIIENIEKVIAASVIHHINETISNIDSALKDSDLSEFDSFNFEYYKNWSKLKGMALTLQFNDSPAITKENLIAVHEAIGDLPVPIENNYGSRKFDLEAARDILRDTYGFAEANAEVW